MDDTIMDDVITTGFRKAHMRAFFYNIRDMYRQMRAYALYGIQPTCELISST